MAITPGFTLVEIRDFVNEYQIARYGQKAAWLELHGISRSTIERWRLAVVEGDLDRGLVPREGRVMTISPSERTALGKAIGLLRARGVEEPSTPRIRRVHHLPE